MYFYEVLVADRSYKGASALTYTCSRALPLYTIVIVPLQRKQVLGVVVRKVTAPSFATKPMSLLGKLPPLPQQLIEMMKWLHAYYPAGMGTVIQQFLPSGLIKNPASTPMENHPSERVALPDLTVDQKQALKLIHAPDTYILHGETGSGKTRVYIELAKRTLAESKSSIVLTPEIGLTPQLTLLFEQALGSENVITIHSQLTEKQRLNNWKQILCTEHPLVILGPRSALFTPVKNVGLIVLDESHENSYKQEQAPHYHASKVAAQLASLHKAILVLGSATPSVTDYFLAQAKHKTVVRMQHAAKGADSYPLELRVVDLKDRSRFTQQPHISNDLLGAIRESIQKGEQSLVFLNRRGTARVVLCEKCGWQATCPHCNLPLTYHGDTHMVRCHTCGYGQKAFTSCLACGSTDIIMKSIGTKAVVAELQASFPDARIQRFDTDNKKAERLEAHYHDVIAGKTDIIVGTQIVAKGLDLPKLSTVGVVLADTSLYMPDYTSQEKSYQLLRQVIGRVGRGHRASKVIVQTYDPNSRLMHETLQGTWDEFYANEIRERQQYLFPPFCHTLKLTCTRASSKSAEKSASVFAQKIRESTLRVTVDGPMPSYREKAQGKYQWQLIIKARERSKLLEIIHMLPANWGYDIDPLNLL